MWRESEMRMIVAGGGTGGHFFPGLAVAEALVADGGSTVLFVGSAQGIEARIVPKTAFSFEALKIRGARGGGARALLEFALMLPVAVGRALRVLGSFQPQIVLGLGGYGSVPVVVAAWMRRTPSVLLEQNVRPGMANRMLAWISKRVCTNFADSAAFFPPGKTVHTGNPVRRLVDAVEAPHRGFTVFAFGGSQGARTINHAMVDAVQLLRERLAGLRVVHQTGAADEEWVRGRYRDMAVDAAVVAFVEDMGRAYGQADVVVCRAGATTLAELAAVGKPAILVPYPYAADDHQRANAEVLVRANAAEMILDRELTAARLADTLLRLANDQPRLQAMAQAMQALAMPDATQRVVRVCREVVEESGRRE
jgi:UDP-N-acetylglucosamine--N-acetylmuramyl-(pentapeptide) pyrophosphoryl-undecaprenol N-acetylglucosamine transferase